MDYRAEIRNAIRDTIREMLLDGAVQAVVKSVDKDAGTIVARGLKEDVDYHDVRLRAVLSDTADRGLLVYPKIGSQVSIVWLDGIDTLGFVAQVSEIESFRLVVDNGVSLELTSAGKLLLNGDAHQGLVKAPELKRQLDKTNALLAAIKTVLTTWVPVPSDGGLALKTAATAALRPLSAGDFSDIQNPNVQHG